MSTRTRSRTAAKSYTDRLRQRTAAPRPARRWPSWLTGRELPALLAVLAELGHLAATLVEWPGSPVRGALHALVAVALGLIATTVHFGPKRFVPEVAIGLALALPAGWLAGALTGASPYADFPFGAAAGLAVVELALAGGLWLNRAART